MTDRPIRDPETPLGQPAADRSANLLDWLYQLRDRQREKQQKAAWLIKAKDLPWEHNSQGIMRWYLHPALEDTAIRSMMVFVQEIPPGSRSGVQKTPGGTVMYIMEGKGYSLLDDMRHDWEAEDIVTIPVRPDGVTVQHVNLDPKNPVQFISVDVNVVDTLGVDRGATYEQVAPAPEHHA